MGEQKNLSGQLRAFGIAVVKVELQQPKRSGRRQKKHQQMGKGDPAGHGRSENPHKPSISTVDDEIIHCDHPILAKTET
jgi:hypothetical protein